MEQNTNELHGIADRFAELDYMTQRTIQYEFPSIFPECTLESINTTAIDHFPTRKFRMGEFYGGFLVVLGAIAVLSYILEWIF